jgi:hypothetical protein
VPQPIATFHRGKNILHLHVFHRKSKFCLLKATELTDLTVTCDIFTSLCDICSQIGLICRRAFEDTAGKIYVVMHAERIKFEAGMQIEQMVNHLIFMC